MPLDPLLLIAGVLTLALIAGVLILANLTQICQPNELLVFSGTARRSGGETLGYRLLRRGRSLRLPLLERVGRLDLTPIVLDLRIAKAYSKGFIPLTVQGRARIAIASDEPLVGQAIERFLGVPREPISLVAEQILEGNLRGVLATLTPEEVSQELAKFAQSVERETEIDLERIGLRLESLELESVSDELGYLDALAHRRRRKPRKVPSLGS